MAMTYAELERFRKTNPTPEEWALQRLATGGYCYDEGDRPIRDDDAEEETRND